jgi:tetratricopeptide (TPR) repeat protein
MSTQRAAQLIDAGHWLQMCGDLDGARRLYEQALKLDPANPRARELLDSSDPSPNPAPVESEGPEASDWAEEIEVVTEDLEESPATNAWETATSPGVHVNALKPGVGVAMDLVAEPEPESSWRHGDLKDEVQTLLQGARDLLELDDHSGAMDLILKARELSPDDPDVERMRLRSERTLQTMLESKLGNMNARPRVLLKDDEIIWLNLDHRAGFVLAQIDGTVSFDDLFEVCGMSRLDTTRILAQLVEEGVISGRA